MRDSRSNQSSQANELARGKLAWHWVAGGCSNAGYFGNSGAGYCAVKGCSWFELHSSGSLALASGTQNSENGRRMVGRRMG